MPLPPSDACNVRLLVLHLTHHTLCWGSFHFFSFSFISPGQSRQLRPFYQVSPRPCLLMVMFNLSLKKHRLAYRLKSIGCQGFTDIKLHFDLPIVTTNHQLASTPWPQYLHILTLLSYLFPFTTSAFINFKSSRNTADKEKVSTVDKKVKRKIVLFRFSDFQRVTCARWVNPIPVFQIFIEGC